MKYQLLDSGNEQKLEQVGAHRLVRPALTAFWPPTLPEAEWRQADGIFKRDSSGGGNWRWQHKVPESWEVTWGGFQLLVKPTGFGHLGFFAEQHDNWNWFRKVIPQIPGEVKALNLFAYSGVGSMAMAEAGALTTHLDAAKGMIDWGRHNQELNSQASDRIRWIVDDVQKFIAREIRRGNKYNGIALDPPTFGRGSRGQLWKIEDHLLKLLFDCRELVEISKPFFIALSSHSPGFSPLVLSRLLSRVFGETDISCGEMTVPESGGRLLPAGNYARLFKQ